jgi:hypothetical protein
MCISFFSEEEYQREDCEKLPSQILSEKPTGEA